MLAQFTSRRPALGDLIERHAGIVPWIVVGCGLSLLHAASIATFGLRGHGPLLSGLILLAEGIACAVACYGASRRSGPMGRYFWRLMGLSFVCWIVAQLSYTVAPPGAGEDLLFVVSSFPLGMVLFLDPDDEPAWFDPLHWADFVQTILLWTTIYVYFTPYGMAPSVYGPVWNRAVFIDTLLLLSFFVRGSFNN
jgi:hypothetical protein